MKADHPLPVYKGLIAEAECLRPVTKTNAASEFVLFRANENGRLTYAVEEPTGGFTDTRQLPLLP